MNKRSSSCDSRDTVPAPWKVQNETRSRSNCTQKLSEDDERAPKRRKIGQGNSAGAVNQEQPHSFGHSIIGGNSRTHFGTHIHNGNVHYHQERDASVSESANTDTFLEALRFEEMDVRFATIGPAHKETCHWLLSRQEYVDWRDQSMRGHNGGFFWIKGKPGSGKSTLMKYAIGDASSRWLDCHVLHFFFNARGNDLERSATGMYRSLLVQMVEKVPRLQFVLETLQTPRTQLQNWPLEAFKHLVQELVCNLENDKITCYIDALDECDEAQVWDMVTFFENLGEATTEKKIDFHVCFSSRHYPTITINKYVELNIDVLGEHDQDIRNFVHGHLKVKKGKLRQELAHSIQRRASGVFLWVVLVVLILNQDHDRGRVHQLRNRLNQIPTGLEDLFADVLRRGITETPYLVLTLQLILFARRPLRLEELYSVVVDTIDHGEATPMDSTEVDADDMKKFVLDSSKGLAEMTRGKSPTIQFIHESVREFLLATGLQGLDPRSDDLASSGHLQLAKCCNQYISSKVTEALDIGIFMWKYPQTREKANCKEAQSLRSRAQTMFPFLEYSIDGVIYHADAAQAKAKGSLPIDFDRTVFLPQWVTLNNLVQRYQTRRYDMLISKLYLFTSKRAHHLLRAHIEDVDAVQDVDRNANGTPGESRRSLAEAFRQEDLVAVQLLMSLRVISNQVGSLLWAESLRGNFLAVKLLLEGGAGARLKTCNEGALAAIVKANQSEIVESLTTRCTLDAGLLDTIYFCCFEAACEANKEEILHILLQNQPQRRLEHGRNFARSIQKACKSGSNDALRMILEFRGPSFDFSKQKDAYLCGFHAAREADERATAILLLEYPGLTPFMREECRRTLSEQLLVEEYSLARMLAETESQDSPTGVRLVADALQRAIAFRHLSTVTKLLDVLKNFEISVQVASRSRTDKGLPELLTILARRGIPVFEKDFGSMPESINGTKTTDNRVMRVNVYDLRRRLLLGPIVNDG